MSSDSFDQGFKAAAKGGIELQENKEGNKVIEHTFFGNEETGLNMLVSEQKQLEKMQAYSFQQFKQIQKMMIQM